VREEVWGEGRDVTARPTIVYLHGFRSSPASIKAARLSEYVAALPPELRPRLHVPTLTDRPAAAIAGVIAWVDAHADPVALTFVGSSLGGYYATHLAERCGARAVLINPTTRPCDDLQAWRGVQTNLYTGEAFEVTDAHFAELSALAVPRITRPERYFLLVETGDEVLDWRLAVAHYAGAWQYVRGGGDHSFTDFVAQLPAILRFAGVAVAPSAAWLPEPADLPGDRQRAEPLQGHVR
jgi:predicted esterase YcpF (UPF0227 family)